MRLSESSGRTTQRQPSVSAFSPFETRFTFVLDRLIIVLFDPVSVAVVYYLCAFGFLWRKHRSERRRTNDHELDDLGGTPRGRTTRRRGGGQARVRLGSRNSSARPPLLPEGDQPDHTSEDDVSQGLLRKSTRMIADRTLSSNCRTKIKFVLSALDHLVIGSYDVHPSRSLEQRSNDKSRIPLHRVLHPKVPIPFNKFTVVRGKAVGDRHVGKSSTRGKDKRSGGNGVEYLQSCEIRILQVEISFDTCSTTSTPAFAIGFHRVLSWYHVRR